MKASGSSAPPSTLPGLDAAVEILSEEVDSLYWPHNIDRLAFPQDPLTFYRDYVASGKPVILERGLESWSALSKWTSDYLISKHGDSTLSVDMTPHGHGDCIHEFAGGRRLFVQPLQSQMKLQE